VKEGERGCKRVKESERGCKRVKESERGCNSVKEKLAPHKKVGAAGNHWTRGGDCRSLAFFSQTGWNRDNEGTETYADHPPEELLHLGWLFADRVYEQEIVAETSDPLEEELLVLCLHCQCRRNLSGLEEFALIAEGVTEELDLSTTVRYIQGEGDVWILVKLLDKMQRLLICTK